MLNFDVEVGEAIAALVIKFCFVYIHLSVFTVTCSTCSNTCSFTSIMLLASSLFCFFVFLRTFFHTFNLKYYYISLYDEHTPIQKRWLLAQQSQLDSQIVNSLSLSHTQTFMMFHSNIKTKLIKEYPCTTYECHCLYCARMRVLFINAIKL